MFRCLYRSENAIYVKFLIDISRIESLMGAEDCRQTILRNQAFMKRWFPPYSDDYV